MRVRSAKSAPGLSVAAQFRLVPVAELAGGIGSSAVSLPLSSWKRTVASPPPGLDSGSPLRYSGYASVTSVSLWAISSGFATGRTAITRCASRAEAMASASSRAEALPESRDAVAGYCRVGAGAHGCGAGQAEHGADLAEIVAGLGDSEHFMAAARSLTDHLELAFRDGVDQIS